MSSEKGFGSFGAFSSTANSSSNSSGGGFSFKPSALAPMTKHIDTKVVTNQNTEVETSHTPAVMKFLAAKPEERLHTLDDGKDNKTDKKSPSATAFVFGRNINTRVVNAASSSSEEKLDENPESKISEDESKTKSSTENGCSLSDSDKIKSSGLFLETASKEVMSSPVSEDAKSDSKRDLEKPKIVEVFPTTDKSQLGSTSPVPHQETGEENEDTLFHVICRLHVFDSPKSSWLERGRGMVRINRDRSTQRCRIVMRQQGIFRLLLNSPIFGDMRLKQVSARSLNVTATDVESGVFRVYLLTPNTPSETSNLLHWLEELIDESKLKQQRSKSAEDDSEWKAAAGTRSSKHNRQFDADESDDGEERRKRAALDEDSVDQDDNDDGDTDEGNGSDDENGSLEASGDGSVLEKKENSSNVQRVVTGKKTEGANTAATASTTE